MKGRLVLGGLAGVVATAALFVAWNSRDLASARDDDLALVLAPVPAEENGYALLAAALADVPPGTRSDDEGLAAHTAGERWDAAWVGSALARRAGELNALQAALAAPRFQRTPPDLDRAPDLDPVRAAFFGAPLALRSLRRARAGDGSGAREDALALVALGTRLETAAGASLLEAALGTAWKRRGLDALLAGTPHAAPTPGEVRAVSAALLSFAWTRDAWTRLWSAEYQATAGLVVSGWRDLREEAQRDVGAGAWGLLPDGYLFQPMRTRALLAERVRAHRGDVETPCRDAPRPPSAPKGRLALLRRGLGPNGAGRVLAEVALPGFARAHALRCESDTRLAAAGAVLALQAHERAHGSLPEALSDLVPGLLASAPRDAFTGEPLAYRREQRLLYSVGPDLRDGGGTAPGDLVFPIRFGGTSGP